MGKLLITLTAPQEEWARREAERLGLPGGVSELIRRLVDDYRGERLPTPADTAPGRTPTRL